MNTDTPIPPEEPMGQNPPDGAVINYFLKSEASEVTLEIFDQANKLIRRYSSNDKPEIIDEKSQAYPTYWFRPSSVLPKKSGMQRWSWDLKYAPPEGFSRSYPMTAILNDTPSQPVGSTVLPGEYKIKFTANGKSFSQSLTIKMDPRVTTPAAGLAKMFEVSHGCYEGITKIRAAQNEIKNLREQLKLLTSTEVAGLEKKLTELEGRSSGIDAFGGSSREPGFAGLSTNFLGLMNMVEGADVAPTTQAIAASDDVQKSLSALLTRWEEIKTKDLKSLNDELRKAGKPIISLNR